MAFNFEQFGEETTKEISKEPISFMERLKLSFGDEESIAELKEREKQAGLRGKFDVGDIADIAGASLPFIGAGLGAVAAAPTATVSGPIGPATGAGIGTAAGEGLKQNIGHLLGVRKQRTPIEEVKETAISSASTVVGAKVFGAVGKYIANRFPKLLGLFTGETEVVSKALNNPKAADLGVKQGDEALRKVVQEAGEKSIQLRSGFLSAHSKVISTILKTVQVTKGYAQSSRQIIKAKFSKLLQSRGVNVTNLSEKESFAISPIKANPGEISKIKAAQEAVDNWTDWSIEGIHKLKQLIGGLTKFPTEAGGSSKSPVLGEFYHYLNQTVAKTLPKAEKKAYLEANKKFSEMIDLFDDIVDAFNKGDPFTRIAQVFGKNKDSLRMLLDFYTKKTGVDIPAIAAGRELAMERSTAFGWLNPKEWVDLILSPQTQASMVVGIGKMQQSLGRFIPPQLQRIIGAEGASTIQSTIRSLENR